MVCLPCHGASPLCGGKKRQSALLSGRDYSGHERIIHRRHRIRPVSRRIERFFKELLQARRFSHNQDLRIHISSVLEGMHNIARELNHVAWQRIQRLVADLDGQCSLLEVERFVFPGVNVGRVAAARRNGRLCHEKGAACLFAGEKYCDLIDGTLVGSTGPSRHVSDLALLR